MLSTACWSEEPHSLCGSVPSDRPGCHQALSAGEPMKGNSVAQVPGYCAQWGTVMQGHHKSSVQPVHTLDAILLAFLVQQHIQTSTRLSELTTQCAIPSRQCTPQMHYCWPSRCTSTSTPARACQDLTLHTFMQAVLTWGPSLLAWPGQHHTCSSTRQTEVDMSHPHSGGAL